MHVHYGTAQRQHHNCLSVYVMINQVSCTTEGWFNKLDFILLYTH